MFKVNWSDNDSSNGINYAYSGKIYEAIMTQDKMIIKDFVPVVMITYNGTTATETAGMLDKVDRKIYTNAGTDSFIYKY